MGEFAASFLNSLARICGTHSTLTASSDVLALGSGGLNGPLLGNVLVAGAAAMVTLFCFVYAARLLINPGEHNLNHPKFRILSDDR